MIKIFTCVTLQRHSSKMSDDCRAAASTYFPALTACASEIEQACPTMSMEEEGTSWWHATPWHQQRRPVRDASLRCIHEKKAQLSANCSSAIAAQWAIDAPLLGIDASHEPLDEDILRMMSAPEGHGYAWKVFGHGFMTALFCLLLLKIAKKCCKTCWKKIPEERRQRFRQYRPRWQRCSCRRGHALMHDEPDMEFAMGDIPAAAPVGDISEAAAVAYAAPAYTATGYA